MIRLKSVIKKRFVIWVICLILSSIVTVNYLNDKLMSRFIKYGEYQCINLITKILNESIDEQISEILKNNVIVKDINKEIVDFNVEILNSISCNIINKSQQILQGLTNGYLDQKEAAKLGVDKELLHYLNTGVAYSVPASTIFGNSLIGILGVEIPIRYRFVGQISGEIISTIEEYGINNALLKISLTVKSKNEVLVPLVTKEQEIEVNVPLVVEVIQGEIPNYYLGTNVIGGIK